MGITVSFPVKRPPIVLQSQENYQCTGVPKTDKEELQTPVFENITETFLHSILQQRKQILQARQKFQETDIKKLCKQYPNWTAANVNDFRAQFQAFDINQDGLIDFYELNEVLDGIGDESDQKTRRHYFDEIDEDHSGAVDFEEFLSLIYTVTTGSEGNDSLGALFNKGTDNAYKIRNLSVVQQMQHGLF